LEHRPRLISPTLGLGRKVYPNASTEAAALFGPNSLGRDDVEEITPQMNTPAK